MSRPLLLFATSSGNVFATGSGHPELYADNQPLVPRLREAGFDVRVAVWDDLTIQWDQAALVVVRSVWDTMHKPVQFMTWVRYLAGLPNTSVVNPADTIVEYFDKTIMRTMEAEGFTIVPTEWVLSPNPVPTRPADGGMSPANPNLRAAIANLRERGEIEERVLIKPTISGLNDNTAVFDPGSLDQLGAAEVVVERLLAQGRGVMVQPFEPDFLDLETSYVFIVDPEKPGGTVERDFSHAYARPSKIVIGNDDSVRLRHLVEPDPDALALAHRAFRRSPNALYARIDVLHSRHGKPVRLNETEFDSPNLEMRRGEVHFPVGALPYEEGVAPIGPHGLVVDPLARRWSDGDRPYDRLQRVLQHQLNGVR